jgi:hypothetical protein
MRWLVAGIGIFILAEMLPAQNGEKVIVAERLQRSIHIDGVLNEPEWQRAQSVSDLIQYDPREGAEPTERSVILVMYDDNALYIGAILFDSNPRGIVGQLSRRDRSTHADRFEVLIDSNNDKMTAYRFAVNVSNVQEDGIYSNDGARYDPEWDAVWASGAARIGRGWSVEMRIPFTALRFDRANGEYRWGINFRRFIARKHEEIHWIMVPREETGLVSRFGMLRGIENINPPLHVEVLPYVVSQGRRQSDALPQISERDITANAGVDLKLGLAPNTTLDVAINPDFGQVEIDQSIINLTAFETFYPEKRPFFLEGANLFRFGSTFDGREMLLFYSRRIGRRPLEPYLEPGQEFIEMPQATRILGAAKLTGRTTGGLSVGAMSVLTNQEEAIIRTGEDDRLRVPVQPRGSHNVLRIKQEVMDNSAVGVMMTTVGRDGLQPAYSGGVDWNLRFRNNEYVIDGFVAGARSVNNGSISEGWAGRMFFTKPSGRHWLASMNYEFYTPDFDVNNIGFIRRADYHSLWGDVYYKEDFAVNPLRRYIMRLSAETRWNFNEDPIKKDIRYTFYTEFTNFYATSIYYQYNFSTFDDVETRGLDLYKRPVYHTVEGWTRTDLRNPVVLYPVYTIQWNDRGWWEYYVKLDFDIRPSPSINLSPAIGWLRSSGFEAWFWNMFDADLGVISLFGDRDIDQIDLSFRGIITLRADLSVQFFTQVLLSTVWYDNIRYLAEPENLEPYEYDREDPFLYDPDFNFQGFNANIIIRWEFMRGSTLFLVWTQQRDGFHNRIHQPFRDTFLDTFRTPMDNVFLLKLNYWFSL